MKNRRLPRQIVRLFESVSGLPSAGPVVGPRDIAERCNAAFGQSGMRCASTPNWLPVKARLTQHCRAKPSSSSSASGQDVELLYSHLGSGHVDHCNQLIFKELSEVAHGLL